MSKVLDKGGFNFWNLTPIICSQCLLVLNCSREKIVCQNISVNVFILEWKVSLGLFLISKYMKRNTRVYFLPVLELEGFHAF